MSLPLLLSACGASPDLEEPAEAVTQAVVRTRSAKSDAEKRELILDVLERFVPHAESFFRPSDLSQPRTGYYDATGSGVTQPRGAGDIAYAYVTLFTARPNQASYGGVPREVLLDHTIQSIRHEAYTNSLSGAGYNRWGNGSWQASLETSSWAFAAHRLWDLLDEETRALVRRVVTGEANILITKPLASGVEGDTGAEDNAWNAPTPALAAIMFPEDPNRAAWQTSVSRLALNASSTAADEDNQTVIDGKPLSEWIETVNLYPDLTLENHGFFNPIYQMVTHIDIDDAAIIYASAGQPLPEALSFRTETIWKEILGRLATDDGDFAMTAGQDWTSKDYQHLQYLGALSTRFKRADAAVLESRALELVERRQATFSSGSLLGQPQIGYETMLIKRLSALWWNHELFGPSPTPSAAEFRSVRSEADGVKQFPYSDFIAARLGKAFVSMSWDSGRPMGLVIPHSDAYLDDPVFSYYAPQNLLGAVSGAVGAHTCACESDRFSTAGTIGARKFSMTAFPDGTTLLLDSGEGATFTYALDDVPGLIGPRPIYSEAGSGLGELPGTWVNAADRLGFLVRGGAGISAARVSGANPQLVITGSKGTGSGNRALVVLPLVDRARTAALDRFVTQPEVPESWSALSARAADGSLRLAVARFGGPEMATLKLSDERGAPVPAAASTLRNGTASFTLSLDAPASLGSTHRFFVQATAELSARQQGEDRAIIGNPSQSAVPVKLTYVSDKGTTEVVNRTLAGGEQIIARHVGGSVTLAGPELEPLLAANETLRELLAEVEDAAPSGHGKRGRCNGNDAKHLLETARDALAAVESAIEEARGKNPDPKRLASYIDDAQKKLEKLERSASGRDVPRALQEALESAIEDAKRSLDQASQAAFGVSAWMEPLGQAQPGELLTVRVVISNSGQKSVPSVGVVLKGPSGWASTGTVAVASSIPPRSSVTKEIKVRVPATAVPGTASLVGAEIEYRLENRKLKASAETSVFVVPVVNVTPDTARLRLARGGMNPVSVRLVNRASRSLGLTLAAPALEGATAELSTSRVTLPALGSADVLVTLKDVVRTSGTTVLALSATTDSGVVVTAPVEVRFTDDLALNDVGAPWPKASATSNQPPYPPALAFDGNNTTFWVSDGTEAGQGPSPTNPVVLAVELAGLARIGSVTMVPRVDFGPRGYSVQVSEDGSTWATVADVPNSPNTTITSQFEPVAARFVRLSITGAWDRIQPPRNVQVSSFIVRAAPDIEITPNVGALRLAAGGVNQLQAHLTNETDRALTLALAALAPEGVTATLGLSQLSLPPHGSADVPVTLFGTRTTGTAALELTATADTGEVGSAPVEIRFTDDLALNDLGTPWPLGIASTSQPAQPPRLAFDGNNSTFWVSSGSLAGEGPRPTRPEWLGVDFGAPVAIGSVTMVPRGQRGPTAYTIQTSDDGADWISVKDEPNVPDAAYVSTISPTVTARYLRLFITGTRDPGGPTCPAPCDPRNTQIISLQVRP